MRVIGGEARGKRLSAPAIPTLRPTSDRVREAIFDILDSRGMVEGARVLDLYAGSGALGIEALSRGALGCTFVDSDQRAVTAIEQNLAAVGYGDSRAVRVVRADALGYLRELADAQITLALVDPPYRFSDWPELLAALPASVAVLEHGAPISGTGPFETIRSYRYGGTLVTLVARQPTDKDTA